MRSTSLSFFGSNLFFRFMNQEELEFASDQLKVPVRLIREAELKFMKSPSFQNASPNDKNRFDDKRGSFKLSTPRNRQVEDYTLFFQESKKFQTPKEVSFVKIDSSHYKRGLSPMSTTLTTRPGSIESMMDYVDMHLKIQRSKSQRVAGNNQSLLNSPILDRLSDVNVGVFEKMVRVGKPKAVPQHRQIDGPEHRF
jgi:hypothetical protein